MLGEQFLKFLVRHLIHRKPNRSLVALRVNSAPEAPSRQ
jgi:hypothetical protein